LNQPVDRLSGGERARVLIARLMLEPADLLLLDEPTNDLDIATLEILEDSLLEYSGALVLVTHDRFMLDRVSTVVLGLDGNGHTQRFADYLQWERWMEEQESIDHAPDRDPDHAPARASAQSDVQPQSEPEPQAEAPQQATKPPQPAKKKLSYLEAREFAAIEDRIEEAELQLAAARTKVEDPVIARDAAALTDSLAELERAKASVDNLVERWAQLTEQAG